MGSGVNWDAVSHQDMYDKINGGAGPSSLSSSGGAWSNLSKRAAHGRLLGQRDQRAGRRELEGNWFRGTAAGILTVLGLG